MLSTALREELLIPLVLEFLDAHGLARAEEANVISSSSPHLAFAWHRLSMSLGAVSFATGGVVGKGSKPKGEYLRWLREQSLFFGCVRLKGASPISSVISISGNVVVQTSALAPAVPAHPALPAGPNNPRGTNSIPQLRRQDRPMFPLAFGIANGHALYAEFRLSWREQGNGEACQLGVVPCEHGCCEDKDPSVLLFSPSAGSVVQLLHSEQLMQTTCHLRAWPLPDLLLDVASVETEFVMEAGIYISAEGQVTFYRRGPLPKSTEEITDASTVFHTEWEITPSFCGDAAHVHHTEVSGAADKPRSQQLHMVLSLLDEITPLRAELSYVASAPPVPPVPSEVRDSLPF